MGNKQIYYNIDNIDKLNCTYNLIFGEKSNGKSYQIKTKKMIEKFIKTRRRFILMRRWEIDMKNNWVESYFSNVDIQKLTDNKYNTVVKFRNEIYLANNILDEHNSVKTKRGEKIGYAISVSQEQHFSSGDFTDCDDIILEEFMERGNYIPNEVSKFMAFYSTVDRKRGTTRVWLIGNTITKANPYIYEWGLNNVIRKMKQGDIKKISVKNTEGQEISLAIEYCKSSGGKSMTIGKNASMIDKGSWQSDSQPHLPKSRKEYKCVMRVVFDYQGFRFLGEFLIDKKTQEYCWYVVPKYSNIKKNTFVFSDIVKINQYWQRNIYDISVPNKKLKLFFFDTFRESNIFYSDDLTRNRF